MSVREKALLEAVRVRPNAKAMAALREEYEVLNRFSHTREERLAIDAMRILITNHDKVQAVLAEHGATP